MRNICLAVGLVFSIGGTSNDIAWLNGAWHADVRASIEANSDFPDWPSHLKQLFQENLIDYSWTIHDGVITVRGDGFEAVSAPYTIQQISKDLFDVLLEGEWATRMRIEKSKNGFCKYQLSSTSGAKPAPRTKNFGDTHQPERVCFVKEISQTTAPPQ